MDSMSSVSPSIILPPTTNHLRPRLRRLPLIPVILHNRNLCLTSVFGVPRSPDLSRRRHRLREASCRSAGGGGAGVPPEDDDEESEQVERALHLDGSIPSTSDEFVKRVSSRAYDMRRHLQQTFDSSSYDGTDIPIRLYSIQFNSKIPAAFWLH